jgi:hypothetical protein
MRLLISSSMDPGIPMFRASFIFGESRFRNRLLVLEKE